MPNHGAGSVDLAASVSALRTADQAAAMLRQTVAAGAAGDDVRVMTAVLAAIDALHPCTRASAFALAPAALDSSFAASDDDGIQDERGPLDRALSICRYVIGCADANVRLVLPKPLVGEGLYLPHFHSLLCGPAPVAVSNEAGVTRFTWADGLAATFPAGDREVARAAEVDRLVPMPTADGIPVLNGASEVTRACAEFDPCGLSGSEAAAQRIAEGLRFLRGVWPAAHGAVTRHVAGIVALNHREHARSHSPVSMSRVVLVSDEEAVLVGDLLVHEASHIRLNLVRQFDPLFEDRRPDVRHESPWRQDPRPISGLVLGVHAFLNVCHYYRRVAAAYDADDAGRLADLQRGKVRTAWDRAKPFLQPSRLGETFLTDLEMGVMAL